MSRNSDKYYGNTPLDRLRERFKKHPVANIIELSKSLKSSTRTAIRTLCAIGYLSSYSHAGKYYTLRTIPRFNSQGLWFYRDIGFSRLGTLRETVVDMVRRSPAGYTHEELVAILRIRAYDTLLALVQDGLISRELVEGVYVYANRALKRRKAQFVKRRRRSGPSRKALPVGKSAVIQILLAVLHRPKASTSEISATLRAKGMLITKEQVREVFSHYDIGKKTKPAGNSRSESSAS
jgi:hypothetical protein